MTSSFTTNKDLEKPGNGDYVDTWNVPLNGDMTVLDYALGNAITFNATAGSQTLGSYNHTTKVLDTYSYIPLIINVANQMSANVTYTIPAGVGGQWIVYNTTTDSSGGPWAVTFASGGGGTSVAVPRGSAVGIYSDGINIRLFSNRGTVTSVDVSGGSTGLTTSGGPVTSSGTITLSGTLAAANGGTGLSSPGASGNVLTSNGTIWTSSTLSISPVPTMQVFTSSGTFTVPSGISKIKVTVVGGGGGGGYSSNTEQPSAGGGGGGAAIKTITGLTPGSSISFTVGAAGAGGTSGIGGTGGTSSFGAYCSATGGVGGAQSDNYFANGGSGGIGSGGDLNIGGCGGGSAISYVRNLAGAGGSSILGGGGAGSASTGNNSFAGNSGQSYGGGGGGSNNATGGNGAAGVVIVEY